MKRQEPGKGPFPPTLQKPTAPPRPRRRGAVYVFLLLFAACFGIALACILLGYDAPNAGRYFCVIGGLVALGGACLSLSICLHTAENHRCLTAQTTGRIVRLRARRVRYAQVDWPIVDYTVDGKPYTVEGNRPASLQELGTGVVVYYDPASPHRACLRLYGRKAMAVSATIAAILTLATIVLWVAAAFC